MLNFFGAIEGSKVYEAPYLRAAGEVGALIGGVNGLKIYHINVRSIRKNFDELSLLIESVEQKNIDLLVLSETFNLEEDEVCLFNLPNFKLVYNNSQFNKNDGVIVYIKKNIKHITNIINFSEIKCIQIGRAHV